jgi:hypothetical protein
VEINDSQKYGITGEGQNIKKIVKAYEIVTRKNLMKNPDFAQ